MNTYRIELSATETSESSLASTLRMIADQIERGTKLGFDESDVGEYEFEVFVEHFKGEEDESDDSEEEQE
jgi:hypothetical protein